MLPPILTKKAYILVPLIILSVVSCSPTRVNPATRISPKRVRVEFNEIKKGDRIESIWLKNSDRLYVYTRGVNLELRNDTLNIYSNHYPLPFKQIPVSTIESYMVTANWVLKTILIVLGCVALYFLSDILFLVI